ncbi:MAG: aminoglycoside phosphotransferase family protein [Burkholderiaceae bacterium]
MTTATGGAVPAAYWNIHITGGWMYLLPPLVERRVLCISSMRPSASASQARLFGELTLLHDSHLSGIPSVQDLESCGGTGLRWRSVDSLLDATGSEQSRFDGLVIHDPEGAVMHGGNWPRILELLRRLPALLRPGAFVYLGVPNRRSLPRIVASVTGRGKTPTLALVSIATLQQALGSAGFDVIRTHAYLTWGPRLAEVIPRRGYRASKNREKLAERVKELVYGRIGSRRLAPAYGILAFASHAAPSTLDMVLEQVSRAPYYEGVAAPVVKNYLLFPGSKAIVTLGPEGKEDGDVVAVMTSDALAIERRGVETAVLSELAGLPKRLAQAIPRPLDHLVIGKTHCYMLNRLPGVTLDLESDALEQVTDQAMGFVIDLHRASSQPVTTDESSYQELFWSLVQAVQAQLPWLAAELQAWDAPLRACVMGSVFPTVRMHGDYKIENVMYDQKLRKLTGVIDWELARHPGLPLLDPLYLLIYNRQIRGEDGYECVENFLCPERRTALERALLQRYIASMGIVENLVPALCAMFVAHHFGFRLHFHSEVSVPEKLHRIVRATGQLLERSAARMGTLPDAIAVK